MAVTPKTLANLAPRKASGVGWGGPAKGKGHRFTEGDPMAVEGGKTHFAAEKRKVADILEEMGARELAARRWIEILEDPAHPHHATMVAKAVDRLDGLPVQQVDATVQRATISAEPMTEDEWAAAYGAAGGAASH